MISSNMSWTTCFFSKPMKFCILLCVFFEGSINSHRQTNNIILQPCICWNIFFVRCPGRLLRGDTSSELGIFEKFDRKNRSRTLGWMLGSKKRVEVTWSGFQHVWYRNCKTMQFRHGGVFQRTMLNIASKMHFLYVVIFLGYLKLVWCLLLDFLGP